MSQQDTAFYGRPTRVLHFTDANHPYKLFSVTPAFDFGDLNSFSNLYSFRGIVMGTHAPGMMVGVQGETAGHIAGRRDRLA